LPRWRKMTWALVCLAAFAAAGLVSGQGAIVEGAAYMTWPLLLIWILSRPKRRIVIYGPQGEQVLLPEREARRRVEASEGWSFRSDPYHPESG
jgi:hypothetical protein